ncbi:MULTISPECIES: LysR family transcriptional regulator [Bacillaceae]|uniref:LysR family transcriptional regulator n=1 Tax=Evansella alkalicola TaxID=745819 RepID=A0ABS6K219_9BACI|nr:MULTISPECIES: LysR family transcriptional regulator [Bacillaceae]MBU9723540.1 LysR family transcriptional regulator [Bacillus alkalicola]
MEFYQLITFNEVAKKKNFSRVAKDLSISQPAVSRQIEALEQTIGLTLFHRVGRNIELTDAGRTLLSLSEEIVSQVNKAKSVMEGLKSLHSGSITIGASTTIGNYFLTPMIITFMKEYPGIDIKLDIKSTDEIKERVKRNLYDIAVIPEEIPGSSLNKEAFLEDEIVLVAPKDHRISKQENVQIQDLQDEKLIVRSAGSNTRKSIEKHLEKFDVSIPMIELGSTESIKQAIIAGGGISFLSRRTVEIEVNSGVIEVIHGENLTTTRMFYLVNHKDTYPSQAVNAFKTFLKEKMK